MCVMVMLNRADTHTHRPNSADCYDSEHVTAVHARTHTFTYALHMQGGSDNVKMSTYIKSGEMSHSCYLFNHTKIRENL